MRVALALRSFPDTRRRFLPGELSYSRVRAITRTAYPELERVLKRMGCVGSPGCTAERHLHTHHIRQWADDGPTDLDKLVLLQATHHRFVHDLGRSEGHDGRGRFAFAAPGREPLAAAGRLAGAPAEAGAEHARRIGVVAGRGSLQPPHWHGERLDLDAAVTVLADAVDRLRAVETAVAA